LTVEEKLIVERRKLNKYQTASNCEQAVMHENKL